MGVMPLPKFQSLLLLNTSTKVKLSKEGPSLIELGRLHWSPQELKKLEVDQIKKEKENKMAFEIINVAELPVREFGRHATEPRISITEGGQFAFNVLIMKAWGVKIEFEGEKESYKVTKREGVTRLLVRYDSETRMLAFNGLLAGQLPKGVKEDSLLPLKVSKTGDQITAPASGILQKLGYDFDAWGNQNYEAKFDEKGKYYAITLPAADVKPVRKVVAPRKKKVEGAVTANAAKNIPVVPPAEEDLLDIS